jgi:hypothetical protein
MSKFSKAIQKKVARLRRITGCKCTPFYKLTEDDYVDGIHIRVIDKNGGSVYENYVDTLPMNWAAWRRWVVLQASMPMLPKVKRVRTATPLPPFVPSMYHSDDEFVEVDPNGM